MLMNQKTRLPAYIQEEIDRVKGIYYPVKASLPRRVLQRYAACRKIHPNTEDEFCNPDIGPNYGIISGYQKDYMRYSGNPSREDLEKGGILEPLFVQKARPDGFLLLNGHHRWAAALHLGKNSVRIKIVNLTQAKDIRKMLEHSRFEKRVTLDLDEVVFCKDSSVPMEKPFPFPLRRLFPERVRLGIPALLHFFADRHYDIWVYTSEYYSMDYIRHFFRRWNVRLAGIVTGTSRKVERDERTVEDLKKLALKKYAETVHIDRDSVLRTRRDSRECTEIRLENASPAAWSGAVMDAIRQLQGE